MTTSTGGADYRDSNFRNLDLVLETSDTSETSETLALMKAYLTKRYWFSASHRLHNDQLSAEENRRVYGKCNNPYGHGHNYALEVTVSGTVDGRTGMVCDLGELDAVVEREIIDRLDHENLNLLPAFADTVPSSENVAAKIFDILQQRFHAAHVEKVKLEETPQNSFEYAGGAEIRGAR